MDDPENKTEDLYLLIVFSPYICYCESVCFFTNDVCANKEKRKLQKKIDIYQAKEKEYWKERVYYPVSPPQYTNPKAEIVKVKSEDIDRINPLYIDIINNYDIKTPLDKTPSTGKGCWFDFLKNQKKEYGKRTTERALYPVIDYFLKEKYLDSQVVGVFTNPETAYNVQSKILTSYGMNIVYSTYDDKHYVSLYGYIGDKYIDPEEPYYKWC